MSMVLYHIPVYTTLGWIMLDDSLTNFIGGGELSHNTTVPNTDDTKDITPLS